MEPSGLNLMSEIHCRESRPSCTFSRSLSRRTSHLPSSRFLPRPTRPPMPTASSEPSGLYATALDIVPSLALRITHNQTVRWATTKRSCGGNTQLSPLDLLERLGIPHTENGVITHSRKLGLGRVPSQAPQLIAEVAVDDGAVVNQTAVTRVQLQPQNITISANAQSHASDRQSCALQTQTTGGTRE